MKKKVCVKRNQSLNYIKNGAIDFYYGLKIETKLDYEKLCNKIQEKIDESFQNYNNYVKTVFQENIKEAICQTGLENEIYIKDTDKVKIEDKFYELSDLKDEITNIELDSTDNGFRIKPITIVENYLNGQKDYAINFAQLTQKDGSFLVGRENIESIFDFDFSERIYGDFYVEAQTRFVLPPIKVELKNESVKLLTAMLFVFNNNAAVLRLSLPIDNTDSEPLMLNNMSDYIVSAKPIYGSILQLEGNSINAIHDCYCRYIASVKKVTSVVSYKRIVNIILANHSGMFNDVKNIPNKIKEDIYKISMAPVQERDGVSYTEESINHVEKNGFFFNGIGYIMSNMGKCISIVDNTVVDFAKQNFEKEIVFDKLINDIRRNIEFTIIILLLKNIVIPLKSLLWTDRS